MKLIEILNLNRELLIYFQKAGIRLDDVQYIDLFNEYRTLSAQGEKMSYIVARLATEYAVSERKVYNLIRRFKTDCNALLFGGGVNRRASLAAYTARRLQRVLHQPFLIDLQARYLCTVFKSNGHEQISPNFTEGAYRG